MAYSTPFTQSFGSHSNMYSSLKTGGMASMPYHMSSLGLGSLAMGSLDPMHPATMNYGAPCKKSESFSVQNIYFQFLHRWRKETEEREDNVHQAAVGRPGVALPEDEISRYLHEGGGRSQDQPSRVESSGKV